MDAPPSTDPGGLMTPPPKLASHCDCPCHDGEDVFHIVPCCGSVLGSLTLRIPASWIEAPPRSPDHVR